MEVRGQFNVQVALAPGGNLPQGLGGPQTQSERCGLVENLLLLLGLDCQLSEVQSTV
jgi:hypothetical protein